jgi:hypothetical protein
VLVRGTTLVAVLRPASGRQVRLSLTLSIADSGRVTGTAQVGRV